MIRAFVLVIAIGACSPRAWKIADVTTMVASEATLVCDWRQTHHAAEQQWRGTWEGNAIMGRAPSTTTVDFYFIGAALALAAVHFLPERMQPFIYGATTAAEAVTIEGNIPHI